MNTVLQYFTENPVIAGYLVLVVVEQVLLLFPGSYPYTLGIPVRIIPIDLKEDDIRGKLADSIVRLRYRLSEPRKEVYIINRMPAGTWGPRLFVGQIFLEGRGRIVIRMAPVSALGLAYSFLGAVAMFNLEGSVSALLVAVLVFFSYRWLARKLENLL